MSHRSALMGLYIATSLSSSTVFAEGILWVDTGHRRINWMDPADSSTREVVVSNKIDGAEGIAIDPVGGWVFLADAVGAAVRRCKLDGSQVQTLVWGDVNIPRGIALDSSSEKLYWCDQITGAIYRSDFDGTSTETVVVNAGSSLMDIAVDPIGGKMYWTDGGAALRSANLDGSQIQDIVAFPTYRPSALAIDPASGRLFWTQIDSENEHNNRIYSANLDGSDVDLIVATEQGWSLPRAIHVDAANGKLYWATSGYGSNPPTTIWRSNPDGSNIETVRVIGGGSIITALALNPGTQDLYFSNSAGLPGSVKKLQLDTTKIQTVLTPSVPNEFAQLALDPRGLGKIFWGTYQGLYQSNLDGSGLGLFWPGYIGSMAFDSIHGVLFWTDAQGCASENDEGGLFYAFVDEHPNGGGTILGGPYCGGVAVDASAGKVYFTGSPAGIYRANLDGSNQSIAVAFQFPQLGGGHQIALDVPAGKIYWVSINVNSPYVRSIMRANISDGSQQEVLVDIQSDPWIYGGLTIDSAVGKMYWTEMDNPGGVKRANLDGTNVEILLNYGVAYLGGIVVDTRVQHCTRTAMYGDITNLQGSVEFGDIAAIVDAFRGQSSIDSALCDLYPCDWIGGNRCMGDGVINFRDISQAVNAFRGAFTCPQ